MKNLFPVININIKPNWQKLLVALFFVGYLWIGVAIYSDYGVSVDESFEISTGKINMNYLLGRNDRLLYYEDRHYGAVLAIFLNILVDPIKDSRDIFLARHLATFLIFFMSSIFFYGILRKLGSHSMIAILGVAAYIFHPHIFSHSFYNVKDIPFLALFTLNIYSLLLLIEKRTFKFAVLHGILSGLLVVFRLPGVFMWAITAIAGAWVLLLDRSSWKKMVMLGITYFVVTVAALVCFMPALWHAPIRELQIFFSMDLFSWDSKELFMGQFLRPGKYPWYYLPVYFIVTTPILFLVLFLVGTIYVGYDLIVKKELFEQRGISKLLILSLFYFPMIVMIIMKPVIYNGWRHAFFIYPGFVLILLVGLVRLWQTAQAMQIHGLRFASMASILALLLIQTGELALFYKDSHPYEHTYYNRFAGATLAEARLNYCMDYWGLAYKEALEQILLMDDSKEIRVLGFHPYLAEENWKILPKADRKRLIIVGKDEPADYFINHFRVGFNEHYSDRVMVAPILVRDALINATYKFVK
jgi:hypothetical protein